MALRLRFENGAESFAHRYAKQTLLGWLRETARKAGLYNHADFAGISWQVNRGRPHFGIWEEYPILADGLGIDPVWDEFSPKWKNHPPTYDDIVGLGYRPRVIVDVAVQHKGIIAFAIEVRHKSAVSDLKVRFLTPLLTLIEIPAYWILGQIERPEAIPEEFYMQIPAGGELP